MRILPLLLLLAFPASAREYTYPPGDVVLQLGEFDQCTFQAGVMTVWGPWGWFPSFKVLEQHVLVPEKPNAQLKQYGEKIEVRGTCTFVDTVTYEEK